MMHFNSIHYSLNAGVARITLNRPDKLNSLTRPMMAELRKAITLTEENGARVLLLSGNGRGFCAGQDLSEHDFSQGLDKIEFEQHIEELYQPVILALHEINIPVVAGVNGMAAGAGASLALACDIVVAKRSAYFLQAFCKIGLMPDAGGTWFLPRLVGNARAMGLSLLGERLCAADAEAWGMIWKCVDDDVFEAEIEALVLRLSHAPTQALGYTKQSIYASAKHSLAEQITLEARNQGVLGKTENLLEGVNAFLQKRPATFTGAND
jgi:2-(1,2-epoxy-1,2-dihydrophenyl)acetyl-CoA isomerase